MSDLPALPKLTLSLSHRKCKAGGCEGTAGVFGVCLDHEAQSVRAYYAVLVDFGSALSCPPPCFDSAAAYQEYAVAFSLAQSDGLNARQAPIDHCRDCEPRFQRRMIDARRCAHPETVFVRAVRFGGDTIGVPLADAERPAAWENAVMGLSGPVVCMPCAQVIDRVIAQISVKKKLGRPKKPVKPQS